MVGLVMMSLIDCSVHALTPDSTRIIRLQTLTVELNDNCTYSGFDVELNGVAAVTAEQS